MAAAFGTVIALVSYAVLCEQCGSKPQALTWQLLVACVGLVVAVLMVGFAVAGWRRAAVASFMLAVLFYAGWAVLLDAGTHGWGNGPVPF